MTLQIQLNEVLLKIYDSFTVQDGFLRFFDSKSPEDEAEDLAKLANDVKSVYYTAKFASLKCPSKPVENICNTFLILLKLFEDLLKNYSDRGSDGLRQQEDLNIIFTLGFLLSALSHFVHDEYKAQTEPILVLLISLTSLQQLVESFKIILPPAHQSRLFILTLYQDLQRIQTSLQEEDADQIAKLKAIMELAFIRYGDFFLSNYTDELLFTLNCSDLLECPEALWNKATHGTNTIQTELGPSFLVSMIKYQWAIIKDFQGLVPDPTSEIILYHTDSGYLFDFLNDQAQQLFLLAAALNTVLNQDENHRSAFNTDADTLVQIYTQLMDYLDRIVSALMDGYAVHSQNDQVNLTRFDQMILLQSTKFFVILLTLSLCSIQLSMTGPLHISSAPSISPVLEHYLFKSDFTASAKTCDISDDFSQEFIKHSIALFANYSMLKYLSKPVQSRLEGKSDKKGVLGTQLSLNMLSFSVLVVVMFFIQFIWFIQSILAFIDDYYLY